MATIRLAASEGATPTFLTPQNIKTAGGIELKLGIFSFGTKYNILLKFKGNP